MSSASSSTPVGLAQNQTVQTEDTAMELLRDDTEQEVKLQLALIRDEEQILEMENAEIAEAVFQSNLDALHHCDTNPSSSGQVDAAKSLPDALQHARSTKLFREETNVIGIWGGFVANCA